MRKSYTDIANMRLRSINEKNAEKISVPDFLNDPENFRPFQLGLTELMTRNGFTGSEKDTAALTDSLYPKLAAIRPSLARSTVNDWFTGRRRPKLNAESRTLMYQVCFALSLPLPEVFWFFGHVYFDRPFNCRRLDEAIYYYCLKNRLSYGEACRLLEDASRLPQTAAPTEPQMYTHFFRSRLDAISSTDELLSFLATHKSLFSVWNQSISQQLERLLTDLRGDAAQTRPLLNEMRRCGHFPAADFRSFGLLLQELYVRASNERADLDIDITLAESLSGVDVFSNDFLLRQILCTASGFPRGARLPEIVKTNFPSRKALSDLLGRRGQTSRPADASASYDALRKLLILLKFYHYWCTILLHPERFCGFLAQELYDNFVAETDTLLDACGYETGNPYDWLFLYSSKAREPLTALRDAVGEMDSSDWG